MVTFKRVSYTRTSAVYQASNGRSSIIFEVEYLADKIGVLKIVECSQTGRFEEYKFDNIKKRIKTLFK